jgi:hypothetical protein
MLALAVALASNNRINATKDNNNNNTIIVIIINRRIK